MIFVRGDKSLTFRLHVSYFGTELLWQHFKCFATEVGCPVKVVGDYGFRQRRGLHKVRLLSGNPLTISVSTSGKRLSPSFVEKCRRMLRKWERTGSPEVRGGIGG